MKEKLDKFGSNDELTKASIEAIDNALFSNNTDVENNINTISNDDLVEIMNEIDNETKIDILVDDNQLNDIIDNW